MGQLVLALSETLELHTKTLDLTDAAARMELTVYRELGQRFGNIAVTLQGVAREMERQRDLPMGAHDPDKLSDPALAAAFFDERSEIPATLTAPSSGLFLESVTYAGDPPIGALKPAPGVPAAGRSPRSG